MASVPVSCICTYDSRELPAGSPPPTSRPALRACSRVRGSGRRGSRVVGSDGNLEVSEIWDSREQWEEFGKRLMPVLADIGVQTSEPELLETHNIVKRQTLARFANHFATSFRDMT
jgi:broad specificity phosphatase PhoE